MKYDESYLLTHDIDWFCIINEIPVHVASAGGIIPDVFNIRESLMDMQHKVSKLVDINTDDEIQINTVFLEKHLMGKGRIEDYILSFKEFAKKGFLSIDRTYPQDPDSQEYHLVCKPTRFYKSITPSSVIKYKSTLEEIENLSIVLDDKIKRILTSQ